MNTATNMEIRTLRKRWLVKFTIDVKINNDKSSCGDEASNKISWDVRESEIYKPAALKKLFAQKNETIRLV